MDARIEITNEELREIVRQTVEETLTRIGIQHNDPVEMQRDFTHLRDWRKSVEKAQSIGWMTAIGIITSGLIGALWVGVKQGIMSR